MTTLPSTRASRWPVWLCWLAMVLDGFDLVVLGTVIPTLIKTGELGFDAVGATLAATISLVGVGLGALFIAPCRTASDTASCWSSACSGSRSSPSP